MFFPILSHVLRARYRRIIFPLFVSKGLLQVTRITFDEFWTQLLYLCRQTPRRRFHSRNFYWLLATSYFYSTTFNRTFGQVRTLPTRKCCVPAKHYPRSADVLRSTQTSGRFFQYDSYRCISRSALNQGLEAASSVYRWRLCECNFISHILWKTLLKQHLQKLKLCF